MVHGQTPSVTARLLGFVAIAWIVAGSSGGEAHAFTATLGGYVCVDSEEAGGFPPQFSWDDISVTGQIQNAGQFPNIGSFIVGTPFFFNFFAVPFNIIGMNSNGYLVMGGAVPNVDLNQPIPSPQAPNQIVCGFWDDLLPNANPNNVRSQILGVAPSRRIVIQWTNIPSALGAGFASVTFQFTLFEEGGANAIRIQYQQMTGPGAAGTSATVGIENNVGQLGIQYLFDGQPGPNALYNNLAIGFFALGTTPPWPVVPPPPPAAAANGPGSPSVDDGNKSAEHKDDWEEFREAACAAGSASAGAFVALTCAVLLLAVTVRRM